MFKNYSLKTKISLSYVIILIFILFASLFSLYSSTNITNKTKTLSSEYIPEIIKLHDIEKQLLVIMDNLQTFIYVENDISADLIIQKLKKLEINIQNFEKSTKKDINLQVLNTKFFELKTTFNKYIILINKIKNNKSNKIKTYNELNLNIELFIEEINEYTNTQTDKLLSEAGAQKEIILERYKKIMLITEIEKLLYTLEKNVINARLFRNYKLLQQSVEQFLEVQKMYKIILPITHQTINIKNIKKMIAITKFIEKQAKEIITIYNEDERLNIEKQKTSELIINITSEILNTKFKNINQFSNDIYIDSSYIKNSIMISALIALFLGIIFSNLLAKNITQPIKIINEKLKFTVKDVSFTSEQLSRTSQNLSSSSTESAASLEETANSIEELSTMFGQNAEHTKEVNSLAILAKISAEKGEKEINNLIIAMNEIVDESKKIENISIIINNISFQTSLLALNASVEAARAGEYGKGFSVVAEAVRNLSQCSADAAKEISQIIVTSVEKSETGAKIATTSAHILNDIVINSKKVSDLIAEITSATLEQTQGIEQISKAISQIDIVTQNNATTAEQASTSSENLSSQASELNNIIYNLAKLIEGK